jgi:hypothetical protein
MCKRAAIIEWYTAKDDADWTAHTSAPRQDTPPRVAPATHGRLSSRRFLGSVTAILLLASAGGWWWRTERVALLSSETDVPAPAQHELETAVLRDDPANLYWEYHFAQQGSGLPAAMWPADPDAQLELAIDTLEIQGDRAVARVGLRARNGEVAKRQTRFYRRTTSGWQRTPPDPLLWGPERSLDTLFFSFRFRQRDASAVSTVASQVDALYATLRRNVGLPITLGAEKLVIEVSVTQPPGQAIPWNHAPDYIRVPSPALYLAPVELTDADLLAQSIALSLLEHVLAQASEQYAVEESWQLMLDGLRLWQLWDLDLPLSVWREDIVQWMYMDLPAIPPEQPLVLPSRYRDLCAAHKLWMSSLVQLYIPSRCAEGDRENWFLSPSSTRGAPTRLDQLVPLLLPAEDGDAQGEPQHVSRPGQAVALATLIEYTVATYGRERLPALVAGLGQYESWNTLLPAVFGVSAHEFEAGWQAYLATHYGHRTGRIPQHGIGVASMLIAHFPAVSFSV